MFKSFVKMTRGALVIVEGTDRTGKSTQCKLLVESLKANNIKAEYMNFPCRTTTIGQHINEYLKSQTHFPDETIHLLFSANRWECIDTILNKLYSGVTLIVDRYCYSGVAFSAAKGLDIEWCKSSDRGLPKPDKVYFLTMPIEQLKERNGFGGERYEKLEFQEKVLETYKQLTDESWSIIAANRTVEEVQKDLLHRTLKLIPNVASEPIGKIWTNSHFNNS